MLISRNWEAYCADYKFARNFYNLFFVISLESFSRSVSMHRGIQVRRWIALKREYLRRCAFRILWGMGESHAVAATSDGLTKRLTPRIKRANDLFSFEFSSLSFLMVIMTKGLCKRTAITSLWYCDLFQGRIYTKA